MDLSRNHIEKIEGLDALKQLRHLNLSHNHIRRIEHLSRNRALRYLILSHNQIKEVDGLNNADELHTLDLRFNCISSLPSLYRLQGSEKNCNIQRSKTLNTLFLEGNEICNKIPSYQSVLFKLIPNIRVIDEVKIAGGQTTIFHSRSQSNLDDQLLYSQSQPITAATKTLRHNKNNNKSKSKHYNFNYNKYRKVNSNKPKRVPRYMTYTLSKKLRDAAECPNLMIQQRKKKPKQRLEPKQRKTMHKFATPTSITYEIIFLNKMCFLVEFSCK